MGKTIAPSNRPLALVTGAAKRIGAAFALHLAARGYNLVLHSNSSCIDATASECAKLGAEVECLKADISNPASVSRFCEDLTRVIADSGQNGLDLLVNCAAVFPDSDFGSLEHASLEKCFSTNLFAPLLFIQNLPLVKEARGSLVVNLLDSRLARRCKPRLGYSLSKVALAEATVQLAIILAPAIRVNAICPGPTLAPKEYLASEDGDNYLAQLIQTLPLKQRVELGDLTAALDYLIDAHRVTGQLLFVDSGEHLS